MALKDYIYQLMTQQPRNLWDRLIANDLWIISIFYGLILQLTRGLYRIGLLKVYTPAKPVVCVGNITVGGTGKTPLVIEIAKELQLRGKKVAILSRGYGADESGNNDEIRMIKEQLPNVHIAIGANRRESIEKTLTQNDVDLFIADDAFSHFPLKCQLNIVTINATNPFGNGHLIPRGILREEKSALKRADIFILTKCTHSLNLDNLIQELKSIQPQALVIKSIYQPSCFKDVFSSKHIHLNEMSTRNIAVLSAIADPASFEGLIANMGFTISTVFRYQDHHIYTPKNMDEIVKKLRQENLNILVTTHKDAVKISPLQNLFEGIYVLQLNIDFKFLDSKEALIERITSM